MKGGQSNVVLASSKINYLHLWESFQVIKLTTMPLNLVRTVATQSTRGFAHTTWVSGPPRTRIPFAEKCVHGVLIAGGVLAGPMYILTQIENYKKRD